MPSGSVRPSGVTEMEEIVGAVTAAVVDCETLFSVAVIIAVPAKSPVIAPVAFTVATVFADVLQVTSAVKSALLPSVYVPVAVSCCIVLTGIEGLAGAIVRELRFAPAPPPPVPPPPPPPPELLTVSAADPASPPD